MKSFWEYQLHINWKSLSIHSFSKPSWLVPQGSLEFSSSKVNSIIFFCNLTLSASNSFARVSEVSKASQSSISETKWILINIYYWVPNRHTRYLSALGFWNIKFEKLSLMNSIFCLFQTRILQATRYTGSKNQRGYIMSTPLPLWNSISTLGKEIDDEKNIAS